MQSLFELYLHSTMYLLIYEEFEDRGDSVHWTIKKVKLYEVSVVTFPAYTDTNVSARKLELEEIKRRSFEMWKDKVTKKLKGEV